jgi:hypothetical protein
MSLFTLIIFNAETSGVSLSFSADLLNYGVGGMRYEVNSTRQYHILIAIYDTNTIVSIDRAITLLMYHSNAGVIVIVWPYSSNHAHD